MEISIPIDALASALGESTDTFVSQFVEQAEGEEDARPLTGDALNAKLKAVFDETKNRFLTEGQRTGKRERMSEFERQVRAKYGDQYKQQGEALIDAIVAAKAQEAEQLRKELEAANSKGIKASDLKGLSEEEAKAFIANHPFHAQALEAMKAEVAKREEIFEAYKQQIETEKVVSVVKARALETLDNQYRPKLTGKPEIDKNLREAYLEKVLKSAKFKLGENDIETLDEHGEPLKNANYIKMTFDQLAIETASQYFEQHPVDPSKTAPGATNGKTTTSGVVMPDWSKMKRDDITPTVLKEPDLGKRDELLKSATAFLNSNPAFVG